MNAHWPEPDRRELFVAGAAGIIWALLGVALMARGDGFSPPPSKGGVRGGTADASIALRFEALSDATVANPSPVPSLRGRGASASCRIANHLPTGVINLGSGTLIDVTVDRQRGLILTCAHLFTEGTGTVIVTFPGRPTHGARLLAIDARADLASLAIARPPVAPSAVDLENAPTGMLTACGFGPTGAFRAIDAPLIGTAHSAGQVSLQLGGAVRSGDSGGGVFDASGRLVAVAWGEAGGVTYASTGAPLRSFLERVAGRAPSASQSSASLAACPTGRCPRVAPTQLCPPPAAPGSVGGSPLFSGQLFGSVGNSAPVGAPQSTADNNAACTCGCDKTLAALGSRLDSLESAEKARGESLAPATLEDYARTDQLAKFAAESHLRHDAIEERLESLGALVAKASRAAAPVVIPTLGLSGPAGWAVLAAASVGSWWLGRRLRRRSEHRGSKSETTQSSVRPLAPPPEATAAADDDFQPATSGTRAATIVDVQAPIERDDREARELLRLSQLEGRDPLQDALAGRLALDRLDALAESDADPVRARLADDLRRELRERFNEIAPTKFEVRSKKERSVGLIDNSAAHELHPSKLLLHTFTLISSFPSLSILSHKETLPCLLEPPAKNSFVARSSSFATCTFSRRLDPCSISAARWSPTTSSAFAADSMRPR